MHNYSKRFRKFIPVFCSLLLVLNNALFLWKAQQLSLRWREVSIQSHPSSLRPLLGFWALPSPHWCPLSLLDFLSDTWAQRDPSLTARYVSSPSSLLIPFISFLVVATLSISIGFLWQTLFRNRPIHEFTRSLIWPAKSQVIV